MTTRFGEIKRDLERLANTESELSNSKSEIENKAYVEPDPRTRQKYEGDIRDYDSRLAEIETQIHALESELDSLDVDELAREARSHELRGAFEPAIAVWQHIEKLDEGASANAKYNIARLNSARNLKERTSDIQRALLKKRKQDKAVLANWGSITSALDQGWADKNDKPLLLVEDFVAGEIDGEDLVEGLRLLATPGTTDINHGLLAERLARGEVVLYLGPDVPKQLGLEVEDNTRVAEELARDVSLTGFTGTLPMVADIYEMKPEHGRPTFLRKLRGHTAPGNSQVDFYTALATKVSVPLVIISASYDMVLETAFRQAGKPYALIYAPIQTEAPSQASRRVDSENHQDQSANDTSEENQKNVVGDLYVQKWDRNGEQNLEGPMLEEALSGTDLLKKGYSIIYRIKGHLDTAVEEGSPSDNSILVTEGDFFNFARFTKFLLPNYVINQIRNRGLWFLGSTVSTWEDRLIVNSMLQSGKLAGRPIAVDQNASDYEICYWEHKNALQPSGDLKTFTAKIEEHLPS